MTELELARHSRLIDPQLHVWGWEIPVYLFLGGMAAGLMIVTSLLALRRGERSGAAKASQRAAPERSPRLSARSEVTIMSPAAIPPRNR